jgi:hypothetical protein
MYRITRRSGTAFAATALLGLGYLVGQISSPTVVAQTPTTTAPVTTVPTKAATDQRVVAYLFDNVAITREEFGDYLIQHYGRKHIRPFINKKIIEMAAEKAKIAVTPQEVDAIITDDCAKLSMDKAQFVKMVLEQKYGKTLEEWREEVIKPRLIMQRMCQANIKLDEEGLKKVYDNMYGEKVQCQIIMWPKDLKDNAFKKYATIRNNKEEFDQMARSQLNSDLAARGGYVDPIGRNSGPNTAKIEEIAFKLEEGQVSEVIEVAQVGTMVIKCAKRIPARTDVTFEQVKPLLIKELTDRKLEQEIPNLFAKLAKEAKPYYLLSPGDETREEVEERSRRLGANVVPASGTSEKK